MEIQRTLHIGLGEMGQALALNLQEQGYKTIGFDVAGAAREQAKEQGIATYPELQQAIEGLNHEPRLVLLAIPADTVQPMVNDLIELLAPGDIIIDVGNSFFKDSISNHQRCQNQSIFFLDCGLSGGAHGARNGASLMIGGESGALQIAMPILQAIAGKARCTHVGGPGAGHFAKMVHNAIEYSMMGAIAEGFHILDEHEGALDLDIKAILEPYAQGSIISGQLLRWLRETYQNDSQFKSLSNSVPPERSDIDMDYLTKHEVARILDAALTQRKITRLEPSVVGRIINGMRIHFGDSIGQTPENTTKDSVG